MAAEKQNEKAAAERQKALETALNQIEKQFGKGAVMKLGQNVTMNVEAIPTGSLSLDIALGIGGLPKGRIVEIYGPESSGKTTVALHLIAETQKMGGLAAFIDADRFHPDLQPAACEQVEAVRRVALAKQPVAAAADERLEFPDHGGRVLGRDREITLHRSHD